MEKLQNQPQMGKSQKPQNEDTSQNTQNPQENPPQDDYQFPTEIINLPSKGLLYPEDNPLSSGQVEMKYMTAKEEDILTTKSYIQNNVVIDKLLKSLVVGKVNYNSLLLGDRNALMLAARLYGYGPDYMSKIKTPTGNEVELEIDLSEVKYKDFDESMISNSNNEFEYTTPIGKDQLTFKLLTVADEKQIDKALKSMKKSQKKYGDAELTTRLRYIITGVNGERGVEPVAKYVNRMLARDARAFRKHYAKMQPDIDLHQEVEDPETGEFFRAQINIGVDFFFPDYEA